MFGLRILRSKTMGAALLIAGTSIGAGMLALPLATLPLGALTATVLLLAVAAIMWLAARLFLAVCLKQPVHSDAKAELNVMTLILKIGGKGPSVLAWFLILAFLYALMSAYTAGGSEFLIKGLQLSPLLPLIQKNQLLETLCKVVFVFVFGGVVMAGPKIVDTLNKIAMLLLMISFLSLLYIVWWQTPKIGIHWQPTVSLLHHKGQLTGVILQTFSLVITSFGFHLLIPSLVDYLDQNKRRLNHSVIIGCSIVYVIYLSWILSIFMIVPQSPSWGHSGISSMTYFLQDRSPWAALGIGIFSFMALLTSFLGVALGLVDFLSDGLQINKKTWQGKIKLFGCVFLPPLIYTVLQPSGFLMALQYGSIFSAILLIALPAYLHCKTFGFTLKSTSLFLIASLAIISPMLAP